jgi:nitrogen fixation protein FixH
MMTQDEMKSNKSGKMVLQAFLGFFIIFAAVDAFFVYKAVSTHPGVVTEKAYEIGLNYNEIIEKTKMRTHEANHPQTGVTPKQ